MAQIKRAKEKNGKKRKVTVGACELFPYVHFVGTLVFIIRLFN